MTIINLTENNDTHHGYFSPTADSQEINGLGGNDLIIGVSNQTGGALSHDTINGGEGNDALFGIAGDDQLNGDAGNDEMDGGFGSDSLTGGTGEDKFILEFVAGEGNDVISDTDGNGILVIGRTNFDIFTGESELVGYILSGNATRTSGTTNQWELNLLDNNSVNQSFNLQWNGAGSNLVITKPGVADVSATILNFNNNSFGLNLETVFNLTEGDDVFSADSLGLTTAGVEVNGLGGNDYIATSNIGAHNDTIDGGDGNDLIFSGRGNDSVDGGNGDDILHGRAGNDTLNGGEGSDTFVVRFTDAGVTTIHDTDGVLWHGTARPAPLPASWSPAPPVQSGFAIAGTALASGAADTYELLVNDNGTPHTLTLTWGGEGSDLTITRGADGQTVVITDFANGTFGLTLEASADQVINGGAGNETLDGGAGNDTINGNDGRDSLLGSEGDDVINGGAGTDTIHGNEGNDVISGEEGYDLLYGRNGSDTIYGGAGHDRIHGGTQADVLNGEDGNDLLNGDNGGDILSGGRGADTLNGGAGKDILLGGTNNDVLNGGDDRDTLNGETGHDTLDGGADKDLLTGGMGEDVFVFSSITDSTRTVTDHITDFIIGIDKIDLSALGFDGLEGAGDAGSNELRVIYDSITNSTKVFDADGTFGFFADGGNITFAESDFIFSHAVAI